MPTTRVDGAGGANPTPQRTTLDTALGGGVYNRHRQPKAETIAPESPPDSFRYSWHDLLLLVGHLTCEHHPTTPVSIHLLRSK